MTISLTPKGTTAARYARALLVARGDHLGAFHYAEAQDWRDTPRVASCLKAAAESLGTDDMAAAVEPISRDLAELIVPLSAIGRITGWHRVPSNVRLLAGTSGASAKYVQEGQPIPVTSMDLVGTPLRALKVGAIAVFTAELARLSTPAADALIRSELGKAVTTALDQVLLDATNGGIPGIKPASILNGATSFESTGSTVTAIDADLKSAISVLTAAGCSLQSAVWLMHPQTAVNLALKRGNAADSLAYPGINAAGGRLVGLPVVTTPAMAASGSPAEFNVALVEASEIAVADDAATRLDVSEQTTLQMSDTPSAGAQPQVSLWQTNLAAVRATHYANWQRRHDGAAAVIRSVTW